ncbi:hypothetical protein BDN72DRAFT_876019 [Pluteus cervinus]|uniref:Uncharacterized protein n=1 Tax=Pluteus cervinus TaxID=181527 RepID=A0ACD3B634_9AGAR|nr:hypothetical protein BDN72DRAFT_876019 [Pluteus cervinus]
MSAKSRALSIPEILDLVFNHFSSAHEKLLIPRPLKITTGNEDDSDSSEDEFMRLRRHGRPDSRDKSTKESRATLLAVALSCRHFAPFALRILWRTMDSLDPLISLLPLVRAAGGLLHLAPDVPQETWTKFEMRQQQIHALVFSNARSMVSMRYSLVFTTLSTMRRFIFPSLHTLIICNLDDTFNIATCSTMLTSPRLRHLCVDSVSNRPSFASFCNLFHHVSENQLHSLIINADVDPTPLNLITSPTLRVLQVGLKLNLPALRTWANLSLLRELHLHLIGDVAEDALPFQSLESLHITGSMQSITAFLVSCECNLQAIFIKLPPKWHLTDGSGPAPRLLFGIIGEKWKTSLRHAELDCASNYPVPSRVTDCWDGFSETIKPLQAIPLLTFRILNSPYRFSSTLSLVSILSRFPHAHTLELLWSKTGKGLTFGELRTIAEVCPNLRHLGISVNLDANTPKLPALNHGLKTLLVLSSDITGEVGDVALNLDRLFPYLTTIQIYQTPLQLAKLGGRRTSGRWKEVERMLEFFRQARDR